MYHDNCSARGYSANSIKDIAIDMGNAASNILVTLKDGSTLVIGAAGNVMKTASQAATQVVDYGQRVIGHVVENWDDLADQAEQWTAEKFITFNKAVERQMDLLLGNYKQTLQDLYALSTGFYQWLQEYVNTVQGDKLLPVILTSM